MEYILQQIKNAFKSCYQVTIRVRNFRNNLVKIFDLFQMYSNKGCQSASDQFFGPRKNSNPQFKLQIRIDNFYNFCSIKKIWYF